MKITFKEFLNEMTLRVGKMNNMPFPNFNEHELKHEGKMQHGYDVYSFIWNNTIIYGVEIDNDFVSFIQLKEINLPNIGKSYEALNMKSKSNTGFKMIIIKLIHFLTLHIGTTILFGDVHSIDTQMLIKVSQKYFNIKLYNMNNGEYFDFTYDKYLELSSNIHKTEWRVLFIGAKYPMNESDMPYPGDRSLWTYGDFFNDVDIIDIWDEYENYI